MDKFILVLFTLLVLSGNSWAAILVSNASGGLETTVTTLEAARTGASYANKTIIVTSPLTQAQSNITGAWPNDRGLEIRFGGSVANSTAFTFTDGRVFSAWQGNVFKGAGVVTFTNYGPDKVFEAWFPGSDIGVRVNNAMTSMPLGGEVTLPKGNISYSTDIYVPRTGYVYSIKGQGINVTALTYTGAGYGVNVDQDAETVKCQLYDFELIGTSAGIAGIVVGSSRFSMLERVWVHGFTSGIGIWCKASSPGAHHSITINDSQSWNNATGLVIENIFNFTMNGGALESNIGRELSITTSGTVYFNGVVVESPWEAADITVPSVRIDRCSTVAFNNCYTEFPFVENPILLIDSQVTFNNCGLGGRDNLVFIKNTGTPPGLSVVNSCTFSGADIYHTIAVTSEESVPDTLIEQNCNYLFCTATKNDQFRLKAKCSFNGISSASGGVSSVVKHGITSVVRESAGLYVITASRPISDAVFTVTAERGDVTGIIYSSVTSGGLDVAIVRVYNSAGNLYDARTVQFTAH